MGLLRSLRGLFDEEFLVKNTIGIQEKMYWSLKAQSPGQEEHQYLAQIWLSRANVRGLNPNDPQVQSTAWPATFLFACMDPPGSIRALAIKMVQEEVPPQVLEKHPALTEEFEALMAPVFAAQDQGTLEKLYAARNPHLAARAQK